MSVAWGGSICVVQSFPYKSFKIEGMQIIHSMKTVIASKDQKLVFPNRGRMKRPLTRNIGSRCGLYDLPANWDCWFLRISFQKESFFIDWRWNWREVFHHALMKTALFEKK